MSAKIRVTQALLFGNGEAVVRWEGHNGKREKRVSALAVDSWVMKLARVVFSDPELTKASVGGINGELDIRGTLSWDKDEVDLEFEPDPEHDGHTRTLIARMVHDS